jgi:hypothetical protein
MDALYIDLIRGLGTHGINSALALIIFFVARAKYRDIMHENVRQCQRLTRLEKSCLKAGIELLELEDE